MRKGNGECCNGPAPPPPDPASQGGRWRPGRQAASNGAISSLVSPNSAFGFCIGTPPVGLLLLRQDAGADHLGTAGGRGPWHRSLRFSGLPRRPPPDLRTRHPQPAPVGLRRLPRPLSRKIPSAALRRVRLAGSGIGAGPPTTTLACPANVPNSVSL